MRLVARVIPAALLLTVLARTCVAMDPQATHMTPPPQPPLVIVSHDNFDDVRSAFNAAVARPRVIAMLSPT